MIYASRNTLISIVNLHLLCSRILCVCCAVYSVVARNTQQEVAGYHFSGFGAHSSAYPCTYLTAAAALGITKDDVDSFIRRLDKSFNKKRGRPPFNSVSSPPSVNIKLEDGEDLDENRTAEYEICSSMRSSEPTVDDSAAGDDIASSPILVFDDS
jgi:O-phosphoseryl-tRNA(Sec) selenium transferase, SepSecS